MIGHESAGVAGHEVNHVGIGDNVLLTWVPRLPDASRAPGASKVPLPGGGVAVTHNVFAWATHTSPSSGSGIDAVISTLLRW